MPQNNVLRPYFRVNISKLCIDAGRSECSNASFVSGNLFLYLRPRWHIGIYNAVDALISRFSFVSTRGWRPLLAVSSGEPRSCWACTSGLLPPKVLLCYSFSLPTGSALSLTKATPLNVYVLYNKKHGRCRRQGISFEQPIIFGSYRVSVLGDSPAAYRMM